MSQDSRAMTENQSQSQRSGVWSALLYFVAVGAVVAGIYFLTAPDEADTEAPVAAEETTTTTVDAVSVDAPAYLPGEEPIADAAEVILPSVVHIQTGAGLGSGVVYDESGLIVTAAHVVGDNETVRIRLADGEQVTGTVLGAVSDVDIAVIQIDADGLQPAEFDVEKARVGQLAIAVGSPWGLESTVTAGIVSAVDQPNCEFGGGCFSMVQTDAAINPGNSGGPLVDRNGMVIGINVSIFTESGANDGVGFAVPASVAMDYAGRIVSGDPIEVAFLGVGGQSAVESGQAGALITEVFTGTAAQEAGIEVDDVIVSFDGVAIQGIDDLGAQVRLHQPGDVVELTLLREGDELTMEVTLGTRSDDDLS